MLEKLKLDIEDILKQLRYNMRTKIDIRGISRNCIELENKYYDYIENNNDSEDVQIQELQKIKQNLENYL